MKEKSTRTLLYSPVGLEVDPSNEQFKEGLEDAKEAKEGGRRGGVGGLFGPEFLGRLATNPQTQHLLSQPDFLNMLQDLGRNPNNMNRWEALPYVLSTILYFHQWSHCTFLHFQPIYSHRLLPASHAAHVVWCRSVLHMDPFVHRAVQWQKPCNA